MPILQVTTKEAKQVWASPDGQRKIHEVILEWEGKSVKAKSYSDAIATVGFTGEVETYEKDGRNGIESFVKQAPKEGGGYGSTNSSSGSPGQTSSKSSYQPKDEKGIKAMWAIGQAVQLYIAEFGSAEKQPETIPVVQAYAEDLFALVDRVKASEGATEVEEAPKDEADQIIDVTEELDMTKIDEVFGPKEK
jgi:hypothetical protein